MTFAYTLAVALTPVALNAPSDTMRYDHVADTARIGRIERRLLPATPLSTDTDSGWTVLDRLQAHHVPALSVAVIHDGKIAWSRTYGVRSVESSDPISDATMFQAGSLSKPIATLGVLRLLAERGVALDEDVNRYLKRWKVPDNRFTQAAPVTLRHLLSHRAGATVRGFDGYRRGATLPTLVDVLNGAAPANSPAVTIDTIPGVSTRYSGGGFEIAQLAVEDVTGQRFDRWMQANLFDRLRLTRTTFSHIRETANAGDIAVGHTNAGQPVDGGWRVLPEMAAASLWSTPRELARVVLAMQRAANGDTLAGMPRSLTAPMFTLHGENQGLGVGLKGAVPYRFSHSGSNDGYRAMMIGYLDRAEGIVVMTNGDNGDALLMEYVRAVAREYGWADLTPRTRRVIAVPASVRSALVGQYQLAPNWRIEVREEQGRLVAGPVGRRPLPLFAESDSTFFFTAVEGLELAVKAREGDQVTAIEWRQGARVTIGRRIAPSTLLRDVTVIDGTTAPALPHMDLLLVDGRIAAIVPSGTLTLPNETRVVEIPGQYVIPGLIDAHVHLATFEREPRVQDALLRAALLGGVTSVRDMGGNIDVLQEIAARTRSPAAALSRMFYSAVLSGPGTMWFTADRRQFFAGRYGVGRSPGVREVDATANVSEIIAAARRTGASGIKLYAGLPPAMLTALTAEAHRQRMPVWAHLDMAPGRPSDVLAAGVDAVSHANMFIGQVTSRPSGSDSAARLARAAEYAATRPDSPAMKQLVSAMRSKGTGLDATLHVMMPPAGTDGIGSTATARTPFAFAVSMTRAAHAAGVPILAGTDAIGRGTPNLHHELQLLVDRVGLTPQQAIHAATLGNARALGAADSLGSIAVGKVADLVVLERDPLSDIANTLSVTRVFRGGVEHRRTAPLVPESYMRASRRF
jgi:CubicO group peptidase (beta-lactamase class C family)/imidazolonepropionase-like amidohydrolase